MAPLSLLSPIPPLTLFHNPASATSEYALQALQLGCQRFDVRRVTFASEHLTEAEVRDIAGRLTGDPVDALVRRSALYQALGLDLDGADAETVIGTLTE